jgi:hypothetical protein
MKPDVLGPGSDGGGGGAVSTSISSRTCLSSRGARTHAKLEAPCTVEGAPV